MRINGLLKAFNINHRQSIMILFMNKILKLSTNSLLMGLFISILFSSCAPKIKSAYFEDLTGVEKIQLGAAPYTEPVIQMDDILNISVQTIDPTATAAVNQAAGAAAASAAPAAGASASQSGFLVDKKGNVEIPMLGVVKVAGLTTSAAREVIRKEALKYYTDPTIQVRFANYKISVLGEVVKPASYTVPNEKISVLDALSLAGDLTIYAKRENVMLIREAEGGKKDVVRLDLTSSNLLTSPYFYLKQNDVLYVEPGKGKVGLNNTARRQTLTIVISALTLVVAIITRL